jgi:hypothetical protein
MSEKSGIIRALPAGEPIRQGDDVALRGELAYRAGPGEPAIGRAIEDGIPHATVRIEVRE